MGAIVNAVLVAIGGTIGSLLKQGIPDHIADAIMKGIGLYILILGIEGSLDYNNALVVVVSIALGAGIGSYLDLDQKVNRSIQGLERRFLKDDSGQFSKALINAASLMCIGSMTIIGALENGLQGDPTTLITKGVIDGISAVVMASSMGIGVAFAAIPVLILEGGMTLLAVYLAHLLTPELIQDLVASGSLLLVALGLNLIGVTDIKIMNYSLAMIFPLILVPLFQLI